MPCVTVRLHGLRKAYASSASPTVAVGVIVGVFVGVTLGVLVGVVLGVLVGVTLGVLVAAIGVLVTVGVTAPTMVTKQLLYSAGLLTVLLSVSVILLLRLAGAGGLNCQFNCATPVAV